MRRVVKLLLYPGLCIPPDSMVLAAGYDYETDQSWVTLEAVDMPPCPEGCRPLEVRSLYELSLLREEQRHKGIER